MPIDAPKPRVVLFVDDPHLRLSQLSVLRAHDIWAEAARADAASLPLHELVPAECNTAIISVSDPTHEQALLRALDAAGLARIIVICSRANRIGAGLTVPVPTDIKATIVLLPQPIQTAAFFDALGLDEHSA